tara:strand:+ start:216 stop:1280 length:1065 start_codon:yes stop_codon:yes gene_type:complete
MAKPNSRESLIKYCKRELGHPVIEINVDDDQVDDRVDEALQFYQEYHADALEKVYLKHLVTTADQTNGYIPIPDLVTNVVRVFPLKDGNGNKIDMFDVRYQMHLNDMFSLGYMGSLMEYEMTQQWLSLLDMVIDNSDKHIDFNRHRNTLRIDMDWSEDTVAVADSTKVVTVSSNKYVIDGTMQEEMLLSAGTTYTFDVSHATNSGHVLTFREPGGSAYTTGIVRSGTPGNAGATVKFTTTDTTPVSMEYYGAGGAAGASITISIDSSYLVLEVYRIVDPATYTDVYNDYFLKRYLTQLIKRQWGSNLIKFEGMQMPGGVVFNGRQIFDDANAELEKLTEEARLNWEEPIDFMTG